MAIEFTLAKSIIQKNQLSEKVVQRMSSNTEFNDEFQEKILGKLDEIIGPD